MVGIFINYRTGDDAYGAHLIDHALSAEFGEENVFRDKRALRPGTDFPSELWHRLSTSTLLLALIGPRWVTITDDEGRRRLDNPHDYVRAEIREALNRQMCVIPVLMGGARLPTADLLPSDIGGLPSRQYLELRAGDSGADLKRLIDEAARIVPRQHQSGPTTGGNTTGGNTTGFNFESTVSGGQFNNYAGDVVNNNRAGDIITNNHAAPPPRDYWAEGLQSFRQRGYSDAAVLLRKRLAEPGPPTEAHFYLALSLLGDRPPRDHADVGEIVRHLGMAKALPRARLLWLVVEEDHGAGRRRELPPNPLVEAMVNELEPTYAREIVHQFKAVNSQTWRALERRAQQI